jgi:hypothetical protein
MKIEKSEAPDSVVSTSKSVAGLPDGMFAYPKSHLYFEGALNG